MLEKNIQSGPLVSVLMSTYNRPRYVREALESILGQTYRNIEAIIVRDGGEEIGDLSAEYGDSRLIFINRDENMGLPYSFNEALGRASGKYVCYLGDDDKFYPDHVATLVDALEGQDEYGFAYTDLYKVHCRILPDGQRIALSKNVEISRDFDRTALQKFNHVLHVSLMHRRDLLDKTGPCNENLNVLIDWDLTRRLSFFTDFKHVTKVTGEFYAPVGDCDRKSVQKRKDVPKYIYNFLKIRSTRPAKPWPKVGDMSLILLADGSMFETEETLRRIWSQTYYPYEIYLPLAESDYQRLNTAIPNIVHITVAQGSSVEERVDEVLKHCDGEYVAIVGSNYQIGTDDVAWIEKSLNPLITGCGDLQGFELIKSTPWCWGGVLRREDIERARSDYGHLPIRESLQAAGISMRKPVQDEWPFQFEHFITSAGLLEQHGDWVNAVKVYEHIAEHYGNDLWMKTRSANALYLAEQYDDALRLIRNVNIERQTPATLLIEARICNKKEMYREAISLYGKGLKIIGSLAFPWEKYTQQDFRTAYYSEKSRSLDEDEMDTIKETKIPDNGYTQHYDIVKELGDCHAMVGEYAEAQECYDKAAVLGPDEAGPYVGIGVIAIQQGRLEDAETSFRVACRLDPQCSKAYCGLAMICEQRGEMSEAFEMYLKSMELDKDNLTALLGLFQLSCQTGNFSKVIHYLEVYLGMHPGDTSVMFCLATLYLKDGSVHKAKGLLCDILVLDEGNVDAANLLEEVEHMLAQQINQEISV